MTDSVLAHLWLSICYCTVARLTICVSWCHPKGGRPSQLQWGCPWIPRMWSQAWIQVRMCLKCVAHKWSLIYISVIQTIPESALRVEHTRTQSPAALDRWDNETTVCWCVRFHTRHCVYVYILIHCYVGGSIRLLANFSISVLCDNTVWIKLRFRDPKYNYCFLCIFRLNYQVPLQVLVNNYNYNYIKIPNAPYFAVFYRASSKLSL